MRFTFWDVQTLGLFRCSPGMRVTLGVDRRVTARSVAQPNARVGAQKPNEETRLTVRLSVSGV
jgi:hypothetical protein